MVSGGMNTDPIAPKSMIIPSFANASLPGNAPNGSLAYDSTNNKFMVRENGTWESITTSGDL